MKQVIAVLVLGALAPMIQGVAGSFIAPRYVPDLGMLVVVGLGLHWRSVGGGLLLATALGFVADMLSGSLLGHHALLRIFAFCAARVGASQLNLRGPLPMMSFAAVFTVVSAAASGLLTAFFVAGAAHDWLRLRELVPQALINGVAAPFVIAVVARVCSSFGDAVRTLALEGRSS